MIADTDMIPKIVEDIRRGNPHSLDSYLTTIEKSISLSGTKTQFYLHLVATDGNGNIRLSDFIEFVARHITAYAIPRGRFIEAKEKDDKEGLGIHLNRLYEDAKKLFTPLKNTGEGGEMLLFILGEVLLGLPQLFCKMSVKTSGSMHYHGADGIHVGVDNDGNLELYWGESKLYQNFNDGLKQCLDSLKPYLKRDADHEDLLLLQTHLDLADEQKTNAIKRLLDKDNPEFNKVSYCGLCFIGFDEDLYQKTTQKAELETFCEEIRLKIVTKLQEYELADFKIHFFCLPVVSVEEFRKLFLEKLGIS
ncbi:protein of unknown function [Chryseolinea serpens]|uniref:Anti-bacteriophage protein A/HamA C-terminal domain-containing protein n=1 Tax=Chryseolinea serpens TaxID=947013 RepID=A0A1M5PCL3_9BACT|nr:DUF1837 domain-containing protein [Chryseolinea serpens]SHG99465.1 protein of unknown function [Chryseolinea serpens]